MKDHGDPPPSSEHLPSLTGEKPSIDESFEMFGGEPSRPSVAPPKVDFDEDEGSGLDIPSISVTGIGEMSREEQMHEAFGTPLPEKPEPPLRVRDEVEAIRMFSPNLATAVLVLLTLVIGGYFALGRPAEQAPGPLTAGEAAREPIPTTTSLPAAAVPAATTPPAASAARKPRITAVSASSQPRPGICNIAFSWTLADVESPDAIRIHFTGAGAGVPTQDTQTGATIRTHYKDGVFTHFISGETGGGVYTAEVIELGPLDRQGHSAKPDANALARATC